MFKQRATLLVLMFTAGMLGFLHTYSPVAQAMSTHTSSHSQHASDSKCQTACQTVINKQNNRPATVKDQDNEPSPKPLYVNTVAIESIGVGLLKPSKIWLQSSWVPPDITLLSGHYSTSL